MNEKIFAARFRTNEAITSGSMKHLNDAGLAFPFLLARPAVMLLHLFRVDLTGRPATANLPRSDCLAMGMNHPLPYSLVPAATHVQRPAPSRPVLRNGRARILRTRSGHEKEIIDVGQSGFP